VNLVKMLKLAEYSEFGENDYGKSSVCPLIVARLAIPMDYTPIAWWKRLATPEEASREQRCIEEISAK
jgi:hypothetical protein